MNLRRVAQPPSERLADLLEADPPLCRGLHRVLARECRHLRVVEGVSLKRSTYEVIEILRQLGYRRPVPETVPQSRDLPLSSFVSLGEVARRLGVSESYARRLCRMGSLPAVLHRGSWLVHPDAIADSERPAA